MNYQPRNTKDRSRSATKDRKGVVACPTQLERANAADALRSAGFKRLFFFQTLGGFYCVEGLHADEDRSVVPDDQAGEE